MKYSSPKPKFETKLVKDCTNLNFYLKLHKEGTWVGKMNFYISH